MYACVCVTMFLLSNPFLPYPPNPQFPLLNKKTGPRAAAAAAPAPAAARPRHGRRHGRRRQGPCPCDREHQQHRQRHSVEGADGAGAARAERGAGGAGGAVRVVCLFVLCVQHVCWLSIVHPDGWRCVFFPEGIPMDGGASSVSPHAPTGTDEPHNTPHHTQPIKTTQNATARPPSGAWSGSWARPRRNGTSSGRCCARRRRARAPRRAACGSSWRGSGGEFFGGGMVAK